MPEHAPKSVKVSQGGSENIGLPRKPHCNSNPDGKYYIHKQKFAKCIPKCNLFLLEIGSLKKSFKLVKNKKNEMLLNIMEEFFVL